MVQRANTSSKKLKAALQRMNEWIKFNRSKPGIAELIVELNRKLRGHYGHYGITFNSRKLESYYAQTKRMLHKWLNRRGGKRAWNWERFTELTHEWIPLEKPRIYHHYSLAKP